MDNARDCVTKEIVEAEDLKLLAVVDTYGYQCTGCDTQAFPPVLSPGNPQFVAADRKLTQ